MEARSYGGDLLCQMNSRLTTIAPVDFREKIIPGENLTSWRAQQQAAGRKVVVTNGCFDLLHLGHVTYLDSARKLGDVLLVGLNSDASVRELKGADRPINNAADRAEVLAALQSVDAVCVFEERSAGNFLAAARPDIYVKGGDYSVETMNQQERTIVEQSGGKIRILPIVPGKSTTALVAKIAKL